MDLECNLAALNLGTPGYVMFLANLSMKHRISITKPARANAELKATAAMGEIYPIAYHAG
jgi:hypothetical protein